MLYILIFLDSGGSAILLGQDTISLAMFSVQEQVKKYLEAEENAMNERIRYPKKGLSNNIIASLKWRLRVLEYPVASTIGSQPLDRKNAPTTGTTVQPSREPPHKRKGTGAHHTGKQQQQ